MAQDKYLRTFGTKNGLLIFMNLETGFTTWKSTFLYCRIIHEVEGTSVTGNRCCHFLSLILARRFVRYRHALQVTMLRDKTPARVSQA